MKKVLIALDYNPGSRKVAEMGFAFASDLVAETCIVHVIADISYYAVQYSPTMGFEGFSSDCAFKDSAEQEKEARRFLDAVRRHLGGSNIKTRVLFGIASEVIIQYSCEYEADLIITGCQDHHGLERLITGNTTGELIKHSVVPVLVIPADHEENDKGNLYDMETLQYL